MGYIVVKPDELYHARTYSHKYIKREMQPNGRYRYWYKTDLGNQATSIAGNQSTIRYSSYARGRDDVGHYTSAAAYDMKTNKLKEATAGSKKLSTKFRQADKASQIYREGLKESNNLSNNAKYVDTEYQKALESNSQKNNYFGQGSNPGGVTTFPSSNKPEPKKTASSIAKSAVKSISTAVGSAYDKGKNWLSGIIGTKKETNHHMFGTDTKIKR